VFAQELIPGKVGTVSGLFFGLAFGMAGIGPEEVDVAHCYGENVRAIVQLEAMQICPRGKGGRFVLDGETGIDGKCPTQTDGGYSAFSLTSGADVGDMIIELTHQLRGDVEFQSRQVKDAEVAVCSGYQAVGSGSAVVVLTNRRK